MDTEIFLILFLTSKLLRLVWNDEYTRQTQSDCYNTELSFNKTTVSVFNVITNRRSRMPSCVRTRVLYFTNCYPNCYHCCTKA